MQPLPATCWAARDAARGERRGLHVLLLRLLHRIPGQQRKPRGMGCGMASGPPRGRRLPLHEHHDVESAAVYGSFRGVDATSFLDPSAALDLRDASGGAPGGPFLRETWSNALQGRLTSSTLITVGVAAAYLYSAVAVLERSAQVYFDTASMVLMLFTLGRYLEAASRARAARDLQPLLAAESEWATVVEGETQSRLPVRDVQTGTLVHSPRRADSSRWNCCRGASLVDEAVYGESRPIQKGIGSQVLAGSINVDGPLGPKQQRGKRDPLGANLQVGPELAVRRSPSQRIAEHVVGVLVPVVLALGIATAVIGLSGCRSIARCWSDLRCW